MKRHLEVLFAPAEFEALPQRDLRPTTCVVFDVLRATTSMITALAHGAQAIIPCGRYPRSPRPQTPIPRGPPRRRT